MQRGPVRTSVIALRRLAATKQRLAEDLDRPASAQAILSVVRDLAFVQWDPVTIVAPSHLLSFWARLRKFRPASLERLLWREKKLFVHWTPIASLVLTEDYPLYYSLMRRYPASMTSSWGKQGALARTFLSAHRALRQRILVRLKGGPRLVKEFQERAPPRTPRSGWSSGSDVSNMLFHMHMLGEVMVVGHQGNQNVWGLTSDFLPAWAERRLLTSAQVERAAAQRAIRALGTASRQEVSYYFPPGRYHHLRSTLARLEADSTIRRVTADGLRAREERYVHTEDVPVLEAVMTEAWTPCTTLLPPFDTAVRSRPWLNSVFGFDYCRQQFFPKEKRTFGTYVLPILSGDRFIGRLDPVLDRERHRLVINSIHTESLAKILPEEVREVGKAIDQLGRFVGAEEVVYPSPLPTVWKGLNG